MVFLGIGMLLAALAMVVIFRPGKDGTSHPIVASPLGLALFPPLLLGLIAFGAAILLSRLLG